MPSWPCASAPRVGTTPTGAKCSTPQCPSREWLSWYARRYPTVEINATFYRLTAATTLRAWRDALPDGFVFAVKASRYLSSDREPL